MLDFVKSVTSEDADKGMKDSWKRFKTRLIAAFILFVVPIFITLLLDLFIGKKISSDPFCELLNNNSNSNSNSNSSTDNQPSKISIVDFNFGVNLTDATVTVKNEKKGEKYDCEIKLSKDKFSHTVNLIDQPTECNTNYEVKCTSKSSTVFHCRVYKK